ncbi:Uma2 family endonuclease [Ktedonobacter sp. SOSP1-52]|uniref:Uma2 family endonuclease n=1 Tax=Ktedonobacter sp. SOSP1-52 TaxID=2778366 RepID=UPI0019150B6E|nr:Uma2 family endonuclease [Ktedonobacter sp. SOSP1-52]
MTTRAKLFSVTPADWVPGPGQGRWTYQEYAAIPEDGHRYEVVNGVLYMAPSPSSNHQDIVLAIASYLRFYVKSTGLGKAYVAPLDVELSYGNIVQPDVFVLLNEHLDQDIGSRIVGAPDLVVEVASPSTARHDLSEKLQAYGAAGVPEYWVVTPDAHVVEVLILDRGTYRSLGLFIADDVLPSQVLPGLPMTVEQFFS